MDPESDLAAEAAHWLARRDRGLTAREADAFEAWQAADPRHAAELARIDATWALFEKAPAGSALAEMAARVEARTRPHAPRLLWPIWVGAAAAAALVFISWIEVHPAPPSSAAGANAFYRVVPTDARRLTLADGSIVEMRGDSDIRTEFTPDLRHVVLLRGEAHFAVTKNSARPFVVSAGKMSVRDLGTAFDVELKGSEVEVLVTEGKVTVEDASGTMRPPAVPLLVAGQRALIHQDAAGAPDRVTVESLAPGEIEQALAWQSTWLIFDRTPLEKAVEAFNAHSTQKIVIGDASLRDRRLGGMFRADNVEGFVRLLQDSLDVKSVRPAGREIVLLPER